jgi:hypothetical protein
MLPPPREVIFCHETAHKTPGVIEIWWTIRFLIFFQIDLKHALSGIFGSEESMTPNEFAPDIVGDTLLFSLI